MRGTLLREVNLLAVLGIIPAYAGNTRSRAPPNTGRWDHPRVCGEHLWWNSSTIASPGSSPRMRGTQPLWRTGDGAGGIIPAYAGNTLCPLGCLKTLRDHPRVCGEHKMLFPAFLKKAGSSPRMRGTRNERCEGFKAGGIIPAYAGNTWKMKASRKRARDHHRVCGEHNQIAVSSQ